MKKKGTRGRTPRMPDRVSWQMGLPLPFLLALRYLRSGRKDAYVSFLSVLATGGITLGVAALILVLGGLAGLQDFLRSDVLARTPHLEVELAPEADAGAVCSTLAEIDGVVLAQRILRARGWLLFAGSAVHVDAVGYEGDLPRSFPLVHEVPEAGARRGRRNRALRRRWPGASLGARGR